MHDNNKLFGKWKVPVYEEKNCNRINFAAPEIFDLIIESEKIFVEQYHCFIVELDKPAFASL